MRRADLVRARAARGRPGGIGRGSSPAAERVSDDLRRGRGAALRRRRLSAAAMLGASASMLAVALYQFGLVRHLPDPPGEIFDSDRVDAAGEAYAFGHTPDTALALASYGVTLALIGMGPSDRAQSRPLIPLLQAPKVAADTASGVVLTVEQLSKHRALCPWCVAAAGATAAALPLSIPEARTAIHTLRRGRMTSRACPGS